MLRPLAERHSAGFVVPRTSDLFERDVSGFTQVAVDEDRIFETFGREIGKPASEERCSGKVPLRFPIFLLSRHKTAVDEKAHALIHRTSERKERRGTICIFKPEKRLRDTEMQSDFSGEANCFRMLFSFGDALGIFQPQPGSNGIAEIFRFESLRDMFRPPAQMKSAGFVVPRAFDLFERQLFRWGEITLEKRGIFENRIRGKIQA